MLLILVCVLLIFVGCQTQPASEGLDDPAILANTLENAETPPDLPDDIPPGVPETTEEVQTTLAAPLIDPGALEPEIKAKKSLIKTLGMAMGMGLTAFIYPEVVTTGDNLLISVIPASEGAYKNVYIYRSPNSYKKYVSLACDTYKCTNPVNTSFIIPTSWANGGYYASIYDYSESNYRNRWKKFYFNVTGGAVQRDFYVQIYPETVNVGEDLGEIIIPGTDGIYNRVYYYTSDNKYKTNTILCASSKCYDPINTSFTIPTSWASGGYYLRIYDYTAGGWKNYNFNVTGGTPPRELYVQIYPETVNVGEDLQEIIIPGTDGIYNRAYYYTADNKYKTNTILCASSKCYDTINTSFTIPTSWASGGYYLRIYDYGEADYNKRWKKFYFNVTGGTPPRDLYVDIYPETVNVGEDLQEIIIPGTDGIYNRAYYYTADNKYKTYTTLCGSSKCYDTINTSFTIPTSWGGESHYLRIYDYGEADYRNRWKKFFFEVTPSCTDSDGGKNIYTASNAYDLNFGVIDNCEFLNNVDGILNEGVCDGNTAKLAKITCPNSTSYCNKGVCSSIKPVCTDTDGGNKPEILGTITEPRYPEGPQHTDYCENLDTNQPLEQCNGESYCGLREFLCETPYRTTTYRDVKCEECKDGVCITVNETCTDSDDGKDYYVKGTVSYPGGGSNTDLCIKKNSDGSWGETAYEAPYVVEYSCPSDTNYGKDHYLCPNGCQDGACLLGANATTCTDSDGGIKIYSKGKTISSINGEFKDECLTDSEVAAGTVKPSTCTSDYCFVTEFFCSTNRAPGNYNLAIGQVSPCPNGCQDGACLSGANATTCTDSDGGNDISKKGTTTGKKSVNDSTIITRVDLCTWFPNGGPTNHLTKCNGADCGIYEYYCSESGEVTGQLHNCSNNCNGGTCTT